MAEYKRGYGGYTLSDEQVAQLEALLVAQTELFENKNNDLGLGVPIYSFLYDLLTTTGIVFDQSLTPFGPPVPIVKEVPIAGVDEAVWTWIKGAKKVNAGEGFYADFIRNYTMKQFELRGGDVTQAKFLNQKSSNEIAFNLARDILDNNGSLPGSIGLGAIDAGAAASSVFSELSLKEPDYAPWAGTFLFPFLGHSEFFRDLILTKDPQSATIDRGNIDEEIVKTKLTEGIYDLIAYYKPLA